MKGTNHPMRYKYKVRELGKELTEDMEAMSLKKLQSNLISSNIVKSIQNLNKFFNSFFFILMLTFASDCGIIKRCQ